MRSKKCLTRGKRVEREVEKTNKKHCTGDPLTTSRISCRRFRPKHWIGHLGIGSRWFSRLLFLVLATSLTLQVREASCSWLWTKWIGGRWTNDRKLSLVSGYTKDMLERERERAEQNELTIDCPHHSRQKPCLLNKVHVGCVTHKLNTYRNSTVPSQCLML